MAHLELSNEQVNELAFELAGTCKTVDDALEALAEQWGHASLSAEDIAEASLLALDDLVFECETCGWWFETCEQGEKEEDHLICRSCELGEHIELEGEEE